MVVFPAGQAAIESPGAYAVDAGTTTTKKDSEYSLESTVQLKLKTGLSCLVFDSLRYYNYDKR